MAAWCRRSCTRASAAVSAALMTLFAGGSAWGELAVTGTVFADRDGDGALSAGDEPLAGVVVSWEGQVFATTGADGDYLLAAPAPGQVWVRTPEGYSPAPVWRNVTETGTSADLPLVPFPATAEPPLTFAHVSDLHVGVVSEADATAALAQAAKAVGHDGRRPRFVLATGDLTQGNTDEQFAAYARAAAALGVPVVPVMGNHDSYDGGANYRRYLGPADYSFDAAGAHFVVIRQNVDFATRRGFIERDAAFTPAGTPVVLVQHGPPNLPEEQELVDAYGALGISLVLAGHTHANRAMAYGGATVVTVGPLAMGGMDLLPGGYRLVTLPAAGAAPGLEYRTYVPRPVFRLVNPLPGTCVPSGRQTIIAAIEWPDAATAAISASLDGAAPIALTYRGGWAFGAEIDLAAGAHTLAVTMTPAEGGAPERIDAEVCVQAGDRLTVTELSDWPQLQGGPAHEGARALTLLPPLEQVWAHAVGGHLFGGSPVLADGRLYVPVLDPGDGAHGGVVALDAATGAELWARRVGSSVHNAPAVAEGVVVFGSEDGRVRALDAATGEVAWERDLAEGFPPNASTLWAAPTIADGAVYIGTVRRFAALDLATGTTLWETDPMPNEWADGTYSSAAVSGGQVVATFGRGGAGLVGRDSGSGAEIWRVEAPLTLAPEASPVFDGQRVFMTNGSTDVFAASADGGEVGWETRLDEEGFDWGYWQTATPALFGGRLFVPAQRTGLHALDAGDGSQRWRVESGESVVRLVHYASIGRGFAAAPVVTGELVWLGGPDGVLRALDAGSGELVWSLDVGVPLLSGVVPAGQMLFVASWDGVVHALVSGQPLVEPTPVAAPQCGCRSACQPGDGTGTLGLLAAGLAALVPLRYRRVRRR